jgi:thymidylate synthase (FAD)
MTDIVELHPETEVTFEHDVEVRLIDYMGDDTSIVRAMLVSTQGIEAAEANASQGRINFLMKNRHGTPFEHNSLTFFVAAPIKVFREFHRHRVGFSYNETSGRYRQLPAKFYLPGPDRPLMQVGKPGAYTYVKGTHEQYVKTCKVIREHSTACYRLYEELLADGVAKEVARDVLPVNIFSEMFVTCNARSLMAFLSLRTMDPRALIPSTPMYEIELTARKMETAMKALFPMTYLAFNENGRQAP